MNDRRRRGRVVGSWATASPGQSTTKAATGPAVAPFSQPAVFGQSKKLVYTEVEQVVKKKPPDIIIDKTGHHILKPTKDGHVCSVQLYPGFINNEAECASYFHEICDAIPWEEKSIVIHGQSVPMPRLVTWYGPLPYSFSGTKLPANMNWPPVVQALHERIIEATNCKFNSVLLNLYRNGKDSVAWHSDDELLMGVNPLIASLSFGDIRMFEMRQRLIDGAADDYDYVQHVKIPLASGSLLIMGGETQTYWQHRIPKEYHDRKPRINLTFRTVFPK